MMDCHKFSAALWATAALAAAQNSSADIPDELRRALGVAAFTGIRQMVMDGGPEVEALLADFLKFVQRHGASRETLAYANEITDRWNELQRTDEQQPARSSAALTLREIAIVELIGQGQSNKEIARRLGIAPETVKTHIKNVFAKLGVERRVQAVVRAHSLGLINADASISVTYAVF
jgi:LuxR family transcriptional regulator, maltose regulon positive regulatory protein